MVLKGEQIQQLQKALLSAFPTHADLDAFVLFRLEQSLEHIVSGDNHSTVVLNLIKWAKKKGKTKELVEQARHENPGNPELQSFATHFLNSSPQSGTVAQPPNSFVGRTAELKELTSLLKKGGCVVIAGIGGMGKSALAHEVEHRLINYYVGGIVRVDCETSRTLDELLLTVAGKLTDNTEHQGSSEVIREPLERVLSNHPCLIVLDSFERIAEDKNVIDWLRTIQHPSSVLLTSRDKVPSLNAPTMNLEVLTPKDAVTLFRKRASMIGWKSDNSAKEQEEIKSLCETVDYLPLAIILIAPRANDFTLAILKSEVRNGLQPINACLEFSFNLLSREARNLLKWLSVLPDGASDQIIPEFIRITKWKDALSLCRRYSLLRFRDERYRMHPLVQDFAKRQWRGSREWQRRYVDYFLGMARSWGGTINELTTEKIEVLNKEWRNILEAVDVANKINDQAAGYEVIEKLNAFLLMGGLGSRCELVGRQMLEHAHDVGDIDTEGRTLEILGFVYERQGRWKEAEDFYWQSLTIARKHQNTFLEGKNFNSLGRLYHYREGDNGELLILAERFYRLSVAIIQYVHNDPIRAARPLKNLGAVCALLGNPKDAIPYCQESLSLFQKARDVLGEGEVHCRLAEIYRQQRDFDKAWEELSRSLEIREGRDAVGEARTHFELGCLHLAQEKWHKAEEEFNQSNRLWQKFGDHVNEGKTFEQLALLQAKQHHITEAINLAKQALEILKKTQYTAGQKRVRDLLSQWEQEGQA